MRFATRQRVQRIDMRVAKAAVTIFHANADIGVDQLLDAGANGPAILVLADLGASIVEREAGIFPAASSIDQRLRCCQHAGAPKQTKGPAGLHISRVGEFIAAGGAADKGFGAKHELFAELGIIAQLGAIFEAGFLAPGDHFGIAGFNRHAGVILLPTSLNADIGAIEWFLCNCRSCRQQSRGTNRARDCRKSTSHEISFHYSNTLPAISGGIRWMQWR